MNTEVTFEELSPWLAGIITVIGGALRVLGLGSKGLWLDEAFSIWLAHHSVGELLQWVVRIDQHPPLYYLLLQPWLALNGDSPYLARLLSVLLGAATIPVVYLIGKRLSGSVMGLAAAVFLAVSPFNVFFAQETRMYALLTFNAAVAIYALVRLLTDPRATQPIGGQFRAYLAAWRTTGPVAADREFSYRDLARNQRGWWGWFDRHHRAPLHTVETDLAWVMFVVFSAATLLTHNTAVFLALAVNVCVLGLMLLQRAKPPAGQPGFHAPSMSNWIKAQAGILLVWSPWAVAFVKQAGAVDQRFWIPAPTRDGVLQVVKTFVVPPVSIPADLRTALWIVYGAVLCLGVLHFRRRPAQFALLASLFVIPFLGELLVSLRRPIFYDRTLIWTTIPLYLVLAAGIVQLRFRPLMVVVLGCLGTIGLFSAGDYLHFYQKEDWAIPAGYVANFAEKGDLVLFNSNFVVIPFDYYFAPWQQQYSLEIERQGLPRDLYRDGILEPEMTAADIPALVALLGQHRRVWLVYSHDSYTDPNGLIPQTLAAHMQLSRQRDFYGGQVQLYVATAGP